jgi:SAM-dependent methyltransferase
MHSLNGVPDEKLARCSGEIEMMDSSQVLSESKVDDSADFHRYSSAYDGRDWTWYKHLVAEHVSSSLPGKILDLGCGRGLLVECASRYGLDIIGLDGSSSAILAAKQRNPKLEVLIHDVRTPFPFADETFQGIICHQMIEHLKPESCMHVFRECFRSLRLGGTLLLYSPSRFNHDEALDPCHINLYSPSQLYDALHSVGFDVTNRGGRIKPVWSGGSLGNFLGRVLHRHCKVESLALEANAIAVKPGV